MSSLHEDVILDVLKLLPPRSLARFNCVSKQWHKYIAWVRSLQRKSSRNMLGFFIDSRRIRSWSNNNVRYVTASGSGDLDESIQYLVEQVNVTDLSKLHVMIVASCKEFLLCIIQGSSIYGYFVYNPSTRQLVLIKLSYSSHYKAHGFTCYESSSSSSSELSYMIVRFRSYGREQYQLTQAILEVFSSKTGKSLSLDLTLDVPPDQFLDQVEQQGVVVKMDSTDKWGGEVRQIFYWFDTFNEHIVAVDVVEETYWLIQVSPSLPPPTPTRYRGTSRFLGVSGDDDGYLYLANSNGGHVNLWSLKAVGGGGGNQEWVLKYKEEDFVNLAIQTCSIHIPQKSFDRYSITEVVGIHPASPNLVYINILHHIVSFDFQSREVRLLDVLSDDDYDSCPMFMHECYEFPRFLPPLLNQCIYECSCHVQGQKAITIK